MKSLTPHQKKSFKPTKYNDKEWSTLIKIPPTTLIGSNSKLRKTGIYQWSIPAFRAQLDNHILNTCPKAGSCALACYAQQSGYIFSRTMVKHHRNLYFYIHNKRKWINNIIDEINNAKGLTAFRIHDSGDFYSFGYLLDWLEVIQSLPHIQFYAYTKMVSLMKSIELPKNFTVVYSYGGREDHIINEAEDRHSKVFSSKELLLKHGYHDTSDTDCAAHNPSIKKIGLVYHGVKLYRGAFLTA